MTMGVDYYELLGLGRNATDCDIKKNYRKWSLFYHPDKNNDDLQAEVKFFQLAEAYDVLSDKKRKAVYDQFGEEGLKCGVPLKCEEDGEAWTKGYVFHGDAQKIFRDFFGGDNPFQDYFDRIDGDLSMSFGGLEGRSRKKKDPPIERNLCLTLEELYHGCIKKMRISRRVMNEDGHTSSVRDKILNITVRKGWLPNTTITFPNEGDQGPNTIPADIIFTVQDHPHDRFRRVAHDLIYTCKVSLEKALVGCKVDIHTLDNRILHVPITDIIRPGFQKVVPREGMPVPNEPAEFGNLIIQFDVGFPSSMTPEKKNLIKKCHFE